MQQQALVLGFRDKGAENPAITGGKSANLAKMTQELKDLPVPDGFSSTVTAYKRFLEENRLVEPVFNTLAETKVSDSKQLSMAGAKIRNWIMKGKFSDEFIECVDTGLRRLINAGVTSVAERSSATGEDGEEASFAGQQTTLLNVPVRLNALLEAKKLVIASLFNDQAIVYREQNGFDHRKVFLCGCTQQMVRSDLATAGVMFTADSRSGHKGVIGITAVYGLGEEAVRGANTDSYIVGKPTREGGQFSILSRKLGNQEMKLIFAKRGDEYTRLVKVRRSEQRRFCLSDDELVALARMGMQIETYYDRPMDIEWAKCGVTNKLYIVQARPVTVNNNVGATIEMYSLETVSKRTIVTGIACGERIGSGPVRILTSAAPDQLAKVCEGDIVATEMTTPDFVPALVKAKGLITAQGSEKCHAAIVSRELNLPAIVGCGQDVLRLLKDGQQVTVDCSQGDTGHVYDGRIPFKLDVTEIKTLPKLRKGFGLKINLADPGMALKMAMLPTDGVGLARLEFIINTCIGIHPQACVDFGKLPVGLRKKIERKIVGYADPVEFFVRVLAESIALKARAFYPRRVVFRTSDFKTNEYRKILGGRLYEPHEENPMMGFRGAYRYADPSFAEAFKLECEAFRLARSMGLDNIDIMVPFVRTLEEGDKTLELLASYGLKNKPGVLNIGMMCELPSNVMLAEEFTKRFAFASIGSNDLCQLTLGADRDSKLRFGNENDPAVRRMIEMAVHAWKKAGKPIGICGQAPSDIDGYALWLYKLGVDSMSLNHDSLVKVWLKLGGAKRTRAKPRVRV